MRKVDGGEWTVESGLGSGFGVQDAELGIRRSGNGIHHSSFIILHYASSQGSRIRDQGSEEAGNKLPAPNHLPSTIYHIPASNLRPTAYSLQPARRGVLLLVVLGLLAMFGLVAVAFVLLSGQAQRSAKNMQRVDQTLEEPEKLLNEAMMQVARGPSNPVSVVGPHSLLEDIYGNTSVYAHITSAVAVAGGQLIEITYEIASPNLPDPTGTPPWIADPFPQYRLGNVITFLDPPLKGESTRMVGMNPTSGRYQLQATGTISIASIAANTRIIINGTPFSGTGFGYDPNTGRLDILFDPRPSENKNWNLALLPRPFLTFQEYQDWLTNVWPLGNDGQGGTSDDRSMLPIVSANEDYDAADFQNMIIGAQIDTQTSTIPPQPWTATLPSLHRPALVNYWMNQQGVSAWGNLPPDLQARIILRPLPVNHPNFTGSNPNFNPPAPDPANDPSLPVHIPGFDPTWNGEFVDQYNSAGANTPDGICDYQWDVDNDGDGVADSIWVDLGMPARATKDGKLYKPLFAILCGDMEGGLSLNAHGDLAQIDSNYYHTGNPPDPAFPVEYFAGGTLPPTIRGRGFGPADINLYGILGPFYQQVLIGNVTVEGRYGWDDPSGANVPGGIGRA